MMNMDCKQLMNFIDQTSFAMDDVMLYLDTHPCDQAALNYYHQVTNARTQAMEAYQRACGPLMADQVTSDNYWTWITGKWPWEGGTRSCGDMKNGCSTR